VPVAPGRDRALRQELLDMAARDQAMRKRMAARYRPGEPISPEDLQQALAVDGQHTRRMQAILDAHGWPGITLVGNDGAEAAWLLVQHADQQPAFQRRCLQLLRQAVLAGEASPAHLAYLVDRVRVHAGRPQVFGTQLHEVGGRLEPLPIEAAPGVDGRRGLMGLPPLAEYLASVNRRSESP
jgi:hypothetical protein